MTGNVHRETGYLNYYCINKLSLVEIINMAKQLRINVDVQLQFLVVES